MDLLNESSAVPRCPVFGRCGGCQLQHMRYDAQLRFKEESLRQTLSSVLSLAGVDVLPIIAAPSPWHYRRRARFHRLSDGTWGFYAGESHRLVSVGECHIAHPEINRALRTLPRQGTEHLELIWNEKTGKVSQYAAEAGRTFFTQVNPEQNERLKAIVKEWASPRKGLSVLELYAGGGNLTLPLARAGARVTAVESSAAAVAHGKKEGKGLSVTWMEGGTRQALQTLIDRKERWSLVLADPPRQGLRECAALLRRLAPDRIMYVSCNPESLARDLGVLVEDDGYRLTRVQPIDFFPQTTHLEVVAELHHSRS